MCKIEKEVIFEDKENERAAVFILNADSVTDFFDSAEEIVERLNASTNLNLKINYDMMVISTKDAQQVQSTNNSVPPPPPAPKNNHAVM